LRKKLKYMIVIFSIAVMIAVVSLFVSLSR
jgi:hypothetical protein